MGNSPVKVPEGSVVITLPAERDGETDIYRNASCAERGELWGRFDEEVGTLYELFQRSVQNYPDNDCLGWRLNDGPYEWISYSTTWGRSKNVGCGLIHLGSTPRSTKIGIYSINRAEWILTEQACNAYSLSLVPLYDTLGPDAVNFIICESEISIIICTPDKTKNLLQNFEDGNIPSVTNIIQMGELDIEDKLRADNIGVGLMTFEGLESLGGHNQVSVSPPDPDDVATICYTSGTTGNPKGVILTHRNFIAELTGVIMHGVQLQEHDVHISYLPLAHVFERMIMTAVMGCGASAGFFRGNVVQLFEDISELKPTLFPSVPRLFSRIFDRVLQGAKTGGLKETMFDKAYKTKLKSLDNGYNKNSFWDSLVFSKVQQRLGGKVRLMMTGSAPISSEVLKFLRVAFSCPVLEGYGQTETCAGATLTLAHDLIPGNVGIPLSCAEIKLVDIPEMNYYSTDPNPRGEICVRGPCCSPGYYKNEEKTSELIDENGWLHSGDIGELLPGGYFKIIDRKKNIFKLSIGEYVAPEKLELIYANSPFISQIFVYGDSLKSKLIAIVVPDADFIKGYANEQGMGDPDNLIALCNNEDMKKDVLDDIARVGRELDVRGFERINAIHLSAVPFSVENDLLTPTFKLKRPQAKQYFNDQINQMYEAIGD